MHKDNISSGQHPEDQKYNSIPDIDIIDLDNDTIPVCENEDADTKPTASDANPDDTDSLQQEITDTHTPEEPRPSDPKPNTKKKGFRINLHVILLAVVLAVIGIVFFRFKNWGHFISQEDIRNNIEGEYSDTLDVILPLTDSEGKIVPLNTDDGLSIAFFGNSPFADDRDSEDNLVNMIGEMTGATVYNCSIGTSYLASERPYFIAEERPRDAYTFYWLSVLATDLGDNLMFEQAANVLGDDIPADANLACDTIRSIDFDTVDVVAIMYDGYDYLISHPMYNDDNPSDITRFTGNLDAGIKLFQSVYPHIRIIVLSPAYAFSNEVDENGEYISSDQIRYAEDVFSTYVIKQYAACAENQVTFIDNLYGTITEDNAKDYLIDNIHLNVEGRKKIAERFIYALNYYDKE